jgi:hypothetical protein
LLPLLSFIIAIATTPSLITDDPGFPTQNMFSRTASVVVSITWWPIAHLLEHFGLNLGIGTAIAVGMLVTPVAFFGISLVITYLVSIAGPIASSVLSIGLNRLTWKLVRRMGFGNDTLGEVSINADSSCAWLGPSWLPLPERLSNDITELSNKAASVAVGKFRGLIGDLTLKDKEANAFLFSEYLTWDELIHCSYFNVPRFRMLVAYAIAHSEGFKPTEAFRSHPDYNLVAHWYEEMKPKAAQS